LRFLRCRAVRATSVGSDAFQRLAVPRATILAQYR